MGLCLRGKDAYLVIGRVWSKPGCGSLLSQHLAFFPHWLEMLPLDTRCLNGWTVFWSSQYCECLSRSWPNLSHFWLWYINCSQGDSWAEQGNAVINCGTAALLTERVKMKLGYGKEERGHGKSEGAVDTDLHCKDSGMWGGSCSS